MRDFQVAALDFRLESIATYPVLGRTNHQSQILYFPASSEKAVGLIQNSWTHRHTLKLSQKTLNPESCLASM